MDGAVFIVVGNFSRVRGCQTMQDNEPRVSVDTARELVAEREHNEQAAEQKFVDLLLDIG